jgi:hypothetical protein
LLSAASHGTQKTGILFSFVFFFFFVFLCTSIAKRQLSVFFYSYYEFAYQLVPTQQQKPAPSSTAQNKAGTEKFLGKRKSGEASSVVKEDEKQADGKKQKRDNLLASKITKDKVDGEEGSRKKPTRKKHKDEVHFPFHFRAENKKNSLFPLQCQLIRSSDDSLHARTVSGNLRTRTPFRRILRAGSSVL